MIKFVLNPFLTIQKHKDHYTVHDPVSDNYFQISKTEFGFLKKLKGPKDIIDSFAEENIILPADPKMEFSDNIIKEISRISKNLDSETISKIEEIFKASSNDEDVFNKISKIKNGRQLLYLAGISSKRKRSNFLSKILYFKIPLFNPESFIRKNAAIADIFWNKKVQYLILFLNLIAIPIFFMNFGGFHASFSSFFGNPTFIGIMSFIFLFLLQGFVHEFAHGFACARYIRPSREIGLVFMFLFPGFYIDTSPAYLLKEKSKKIAISFAGILMNDLFIMLYIATFLLLPAGSIRDVMGTFIIINTVFVLIAYSPFIKTDTYFMLSDYVEIPNLRERGYQAIKDLLKGKERNWLLIAYGIISLLFTIFLTLLSIVVIKNIVRSLF